MRYKIDYIQIIKSGWKDYGHSRKILFVKDISVKVSTNHVFILTLDNKKKIIGAVHTGWRGAYKKILLKIVKYLLKKGSSLNNLYFVIGPSIAQKNYEVGVKFKKKFFKQDIKNKKYFKNAKKRIFFSLNDYIKGQLQSLRIKNIEIIKKDTYNQKNNFFSSRRSKKNNLDYGRNISVIMIK